MDYSKVTRMRIVGEGRLHSDYQCGREEALHFCIRMANQNCTLQETATRLGVSKSWVGRLLQEYGVPSAFKPGTPKSKGGVSRYDE
jgi:hypothetical protein